ncbi:MAG: hypothetical protein ABIQ99_09515 [Thermoflexales bacterium]
MNSRLLPLTPPQPALPTTERRGTMRRIALPSMPWMELGFFAVMILGLIRVGA